MKNEWTIEKWQYRNGIKTNVIFHHHEQYKVFSETGICHLCKKPVPNYILFQFKLLEDYLPKFYTSNMIDFITDSMFYSYDKNIGELKIKKLVAIPEMLLEDYGNIVKKINKND